MSKEQGPKRRKTSKKNKASWRKNTDVKDVQDFLAERSREQVTGVPAAEKSNEQLFFEERLAKDTDNAFTVKKSKKPLRSELSLHPNSAVPGFPPQKRKKGNKSSMIVTSGLTDSSGDDEGYDKSASYQTLHTQQSKKLAKWVRENPPKSTVILARKDLWSQDGAASLVGIPDDHYQKVTGKKPVNRPASLGTRPSALPSVELPHAGMSYNPTFEDHQELLGMAVEIEKGREIAAEKLEKKVQLAELTFSQREKVWMDEMTEGLLSDGGGSHGSDSDEDVILKRPVRAENRKTKKQRRKEKMRREMVKLKLSEKAQKMKMDEVFRLRSIKKEISSEEVAALEKTKRRLEDEKMAPYQTQRLGKHRFEEVDIECKLSTELTGSLRNMKPEGSLALDRYKSLQKRNIIEPRELMKRRRKYRLLVKEKRSCKLPEELPKPFKSFKRSA
ncbi:ribosome biogenesis protein NOP53-like [Halichondria panicea]|uniref:ribosome biogenesis protein NOP53-like n=1 Tax=Halichondria panicea TaxID=6063 RepID=UPI00312B63CE